MSYDDDEEDSDEYDYDEEDCQEYDCQNEGCRGLKTFWHNSEEWFEEKGAHLPSNCKPCKRWNDGEKEIGPITATCQFCAYTWPIEATYRIIYHKKKGNWDEYWSKNEDLQICRRCMEMPFRRRKLRDRKAERDLPKRTPKEKKDRVPNEHESWKEQLLAYVKENDIETDPERFDVPDSMVYYEGIKTHENKVADHGENQLTHIMKSDHKWSKNLGTEDPHAILKLAFRIAVSEESHVLQFTDKGSGHIIKYDLDQEAVVIIREDRRAPAGFRIETTYMKTPKKVLLNKLQEGVWS